MSKFQQIAWDLSDKIRSGHYPVGEYLPSENELAKQYAVSRETIRKAQKALLDNGYIQKQKGKGAIVLDHERFSFPISGLTSYKELQQEQGFQTETLLIKNEVIPTPNFLVGTEDIAPDEPFVHLIRCREMDGITEIIDEDYLRLSVVGEIPDTVAEDSIYAYFENELGLSIGFASKEIIAMPANPIDQKHLHLTPQDYVIQVNSSVYLEDTTFFQYTSARHRLEKFRFAEFARRTSIFNTK